MQKGVFVEPRPRSILIAQFNRLTHNQLLCRYPRNTAASTPLHIAAYINRRIPVV
jgi:hypothetical protein